MDEKEVKKLFDEACQLSDEGKWEAAIAKWDEVIPQLSRDGLRLTAHRIRCIGRLKMGDYAGALADCDRMLKISPNFGEAYNNRGNAKNGMGDYVAAIADYDRALEIDPRNADAYSNRGNAKYNMGDYAAAIADHDSALAIHPRLAGAYSNRGSAKNKMGNYTASLADFDRALEIDPQDMATHYNRGIAKDKMGDHVAALADFDRALEINPQYAVAYNSRGQTKGEMGDHAAALVDFDRALEINPQYAEAYSNRGSAKDKMGDHAAALADFDRALEINPQYAIAYNNRGNVKANMGDYASAIADFNRTLEINPQYAEAYSNLGAAKINMGDYAAAIADCEQALKINPEYKNATHNRAVALALRDSEQGRKEIEEKYQGQLREQQEKFEKTFDEKSQRIDNLAKALSPGEKKQKYDGKLGAQKTKIVCWMWALAILSATIFGTIALWGGCMLWQNPKFNPLSLLPFILMGSLVLFPLVWHIRMLNRDKHKYWALREDAEAKEILATIADGNPDHYKELLMLLFGHYDKRGSASIIADWSRADSGGDNPVSVENIINRGDKSGDS